MNPNSYRLQEEGGVDVADIAALLDELRDVGGAVEDTAGGATARRPLSGKPARRGVIGGTSVLKDQQRSGTTAPGLGQHRRSLNSGERSAPEARLSRLGGAATGGALAPIGFSTYDTAEAARMEAQLQQQLNPELSATPLGVRLTPLSIHSSGAASTVVGGELMKDAKLQPPSPAKRPHPPEPPTMSRAGAGHRPSLSAQSALPPLPRRASITQPAEADGAAPVRTLAPTAGSGGAAGTASAATAVAAREINFLPIMCARYLRPVGLTPTARWGHTLTPIGPDMMLLFGGLDVNGTETASLMSFSPTSIAWEPLPSLTDAPVARHSHAAAAYEGRYLLISGGVAQQGNRVLDDLHMYDVLTHRWRCVWNGVRDGSPQNRNEPGPRFGHSIVLHEDRLYLFGGKTVPAELPGRRRGSSTVATTTTSPSKAVATGSTLPSPAAGANAANSATTAAATLASGSDVFVFSLNSFRWRHRLHAAKGRRTSTSTAAAGQKESTGSTAAAADGAQDEAAALPARPVARAHHAACVRGTTMYVNGGAGAEAVLTDTWAVELSTGVWHCIHRGGTADAVPREKHALFTCGEALLLVGGCSGGGGLNERITGKFTNFAVVLPLVGAAVDTPCWIPVAMGNLSIVAPGRKSFGAALCGGFVYAFGGVSGAEPATNTMVRFLAADGCISQGDPLVPGAAAAAGAQQLRLMLQQLREQQRGTPYDTFAYAGTYGSVSSLSSAVAQLPTPWAGLASENGQTMNQNVSGTEEDAAGRPDASIVGLHRALVLQRAPLLLHELEQCRSDVYVVGAGATSLQGTPQKRRASVEAGMDGREGDEVDALLRAVGGGATATSQASSKVDAAPVRNESEGGSAAEGLRVYYTNGTARIPGLAQPLTAEALQCLIDYAYWGGLKGKYRVLLEEEKEEAESNVAAPESFSTEYRGQLVQTLQTVRAAAATYKLDPLHELCTALLAGDREAMHVARQRCSEQLRADLAAMLNTPVSANTTMLVVDPHTKAKAAHVLHAGVLMASSSLFTDLLRPLYRASAGLGSSKASNQVGLLAAKLSAAAAQSPATLLTSTSKRTVLIGPVPLPLPAVRPILRYLYTQELQVSGELAFEVMLGAHQLGLTELQALCEAVVAREEVNYQTCCTFYYLSRKYQASFLEEIALLTAVSGFAEVRYTAAYYQSLSEEEKQSIDAVATELGSSNWVPPPQPTQEMKSKAAYAARWNASAAM